MVKNIKGDFMTREEMKRLKENKQALELIIKNNSKLYGYKTVSGFVYKTINDFVFIILIGINYANKNITVSIEYKPIILDKIFWEIFNMAEETKNKPLSFHINGVYTVKTVKIKGFELGYNNKEEAEIIFKEIIDCSNNVIEEYREKTNSIDRFYENIVDDKDQYLNIILIDIMKKDYKKALGKIKICINNYEDGGFMNENYKSIIELAKEYCEERV
jgi:phosphoribosylformylglycinamidine (FGAM) synthase PurS component